MSTILQLAPQNVWKHFYSLTQIPRPSGHMEKITEFLVNFGKGLGLESFVDEIGNVIIRKAATPGMENRKGVILQAHMDMVPQKNNDTVHDFTKDPIETYIDGDWVKAKGTTLGADNGLGVAAIMAVLEDNSLKHGPLEALITKDEETGMYGAFGLKPGTLKGEILLNLDSEDEGELFIGCAGGANTTAEFAYQPVPAPQDYFYFSVAVKGLTGGHSGDDINKGRANANKLLVRFLTQLASKYILYLCEIDGGNLHNAIPREAQALCAVPMKDKESVRVDLNIYTAELENEYAATEPNLRTELSSESPCKEAIDMTTAGHLLRAVYAVHNGVYAMSQDIPGLVETSSNLASIKQVEGNKIKIVTSQRSSILSSRKDMSEMIRSAFLLGGAEVTTGEGYPGWKPNTDSPVLKVAVDSYKKLFGVEPKVKAIHAGLECGLFLEKYPSLDMVSFGPTLRGVHSPDERMLIPTVDKFWRHLLDVLVNIPTK